MESMVDYQARRTNRNLLIVNMVLVLSMVSYAIILLEAIPFQRGGFLFLIFMSPFFIVSVWNIRKSLNRYRTPSVHPIYRSLTGYGEPHSVIMEIDNEFRMKNNLICLSKCTVTTSWLLVPKMFTAHFVRLSDIIWIYKRYKQYSVNFIPAFPVYKSIIVSRYGGQLEISERETRVNNTLEKIYERAPWVQFGYSEELKRLRDKNIKQLISAVDARREQIHQKI